MLLLSRRVVYIDGLQRVAITGIYPLSKLDAEEKGKILDLVSYGELK